MTDAWKQQEGQTIDGQFRLIQYLGGTEHSAVFLTEFGDKRQRFVIKLLGADAQTADAHLSRLRRAAKLAHPHLARILQTGRAQVGSATVVYLITEYAEEDLAQVLPDRALRPEEVREMLPQIIDALQFLHSQGFVHARLKPSNILAIDEQLKLSTDGICAVGERGAPGEKPSPYDPPELAPSGPSPAGDIWSLGMSLVEVLTQRLPIWEWTGHADPPAPRTLPAPFLEITRSCLRRDPAMRCTLRDIQENLDPQPSSSTAAAQRSASRPVPASTALPPRAAFPAPSASSRTDSVPNPLAHRSSSRYVVQAAAFVLVLAAIIAIPRWFRHSSTPIDSQPVAAAAPETPASSAPASATPSAAPAPAPVRESVPTSSPAPAPNVEPKIEAKRDTKSETKAETKTETRTETKAVNAKSRPEEASNPRPAAKSVEASAVSNQPPPPATVAPSASAPAQPASPSSSSALAVRGQVAHKQAPEVSQKALDTIHGKVRVSVKVNVDASGQVTAAAFDSPGPSKYFADASMRAAKEWTFAPAKANGAATPSVWLLRFEFDPSGPETSSAEINP